MRKIYSLFCLLFLLLGTMQAQQQVTTVQGRPYDFSKAPKAVRSTTMKAPRSSDFTMNDIEFWVGEGGSKAGFSVQWNDPRETNALVWGYKFDGNKRGIDIIRSIANADPRLYIMIENADASMGYTICGIGYDADGDGEVALKQKSTGKIFFPIEPGVFLTLGHYDYDDYESVDPDDYWGAGWYQSYWSYWVKEGDGDFGYSGLGASSRMLKDGSWDGWNFALNMQTTGFKEFAAAPVPGYTSGSFFLCGDKNNSIFNYLNQKNEWEYKIYQNANAGQALNKDTRFGNLFGGNLFFVSKEGITVADATKLIKKAAIGGIDGRAFAGINSKTGYVSTANGIYSVDLEKMALGTLVAGTDNGQEAGMMIHAGKYLFSVQKSKGLLVIDPATNSIKQTFEGDFSSVAQTVDGTVWIAQGNKLIKINPASLTVIDKVDLPGYCKIGNNWGAWNAGAFIADTKKNVLFWADGGFVNGGNSIYRYDEDNISSLESPFFTLPGEDEMFSGVGMRLDPKTGQLVVMSVSAKSGNNKIYFVDAQNGDILNTIETEKDFLTPVMPLFVDAAPTISGIETEVTVPMDSAPIVVSLKGKIVDTDNVDYNISTSVLSENAELATAVLNGDVLTITPQAGMSGETAIVISAESNGRIVTKKINLSVTRALKGIALDRKDIFLKKGQKDTLKVAFTPENASNKNLQWTYSDYSLASVRNNDGVVYTSTKTGVGYIYVKSEDGSYTDTCKVTVVNEPVTGISINKKSISVFVNQNDTLVATITPADASSQYMSWKSLDNTIATVGYNGIVTGKKEGKTRVYVTSTEGNFTDTCEVSVSFNPATDMTMVKPELFLTAPKTELASVAFAPANASNKDVIWESKDTEIATVDAYGWVKAVSAGEVEVVATSKDNPELKAVCKVNCYFVATTGITLGDSVKTIAVGKSYTVSKTITPSGVSNTNVAWTSSDEKVATVSNYGSVKGIAPGTAIITCTTENGGFSAACEITVVDTIHVTGIKLSDSEIWLKQGKTKQPSRTITPSDATNQKYAYVSEDEAVATVSQYGSIKAIKLGTTKVVVITDDGGLTDTCTVHVVPDVKTVELNHKNVEIVVGADQQLSATAAPLEAIQSVTWKSVDKSVALVDESGLVTGLKAGKTLIIATSTDITTIADTCIVTVNNRLAGNVALNETTKELATGEGIQLTATVTPENTTNARVRWTTSDYTLATVTSYGYVKALQPGTVTIQAISVDNSKSSASCVIKIKQLAEQITLNEIKKELIVGNEFRLLATVLPENTTNKEIEWSTSDDKVATVSEDGLVKAIKEGIATVTSTLKEGGLNASCDITVILDPANIETMGDDVRSAYVQNGMLYMNGYAGYSFALETISGKQIANFDIRENEMSIPVNIQTGVYLLKGSDGNKQAVIKIIFE